MKPKYDDEKTRPRPKASENPFVIQLAKTILLGIKIREDSYNHEAAKLEAETQRRRAMSHSAYFSGIFIPFIEYREFYELDEMEAAIRACEKTGLPKEFAYPIFSSYRWWSDVEDWANEMLAIS